MSFNKNTILGFMGGEPVTFGRIQEMSTIYWANMNSSGNGCHHHPNEESLVLEIDGCSLKSMTDKDGFDGFLAVLCRDADENGLMHNTFALIPCDSNGKAIEIDDGNAGTERWKPRKKLSEIQSEYQSGPHGNNRSVKDIIGKYLNDILKDHPVKIECSSDKK